MECIGFFLGERSQLLLLLSESVEVFLKKDLLYVKPFVFYLILTYSSLHIRKKLENLKKRFSQSKRKWLNSYVLLYFERLLTVFPPFVSHLRRL